MNIVKAISVIVTAAALCGVAAQASANSARATINVTNGLLGTTVLEARDNIGATIDKQTCSSISVLGGVQLSALYQVGAGAPAAASTSGLTAAGGNIANCTATDSVINATPGTVFCGGGTVGVIPAKILCFVD
jgi:hypothetical protein